MLNQKSVVAALLAIGLGYSFAGDAQAKKWTVTQRQQALLSEITSAQHGNQLTLKEANSLKEQQRKIVLREQSMKDKNGGKLSQSDLTKLEGDLNSLSDKIHKKVLQKRVQ